MKNLTTFKATTTEAAHVVHGAGRTVILEDVGHGVYLIHRISDAKNPTRMVKMYPASIFLRTGEFTIA